MSNTIDPVELEFLLKNTNVVQEAAKMKAEISGVGDNAQKAAEKITSSLGKSMTDVNNQFSKSAGISDYSKRLNTLSFSMQQVARELPSLAISPQMFFLAISNNLPILADNVARVREENKLLEASGQKSTPVWKQLASSLFSWQTALVAGITILTVYGKDIANFIGNLFKARNEISLTKDEINSLNESFAKAAGSDLGKLQVLFSKLQSASKGTSDYYKAKKDILDQYGDYLQGMDKEIISLDNQKGAYDALTTSIYAAAKAKALQNTYADLGQQRLEKENEQLKIIRDEFMSKYPGNLGEFKFNQFKQELEAGKGFSLDIKAFINSFDKDALKNSGRVIGTSITGGVVYELQKVKLNPVKDAISGITQAQTDFNTKVKEAASLMENAVGSKRQSQIVTTKQLLETQLTEAKLMPDGPDKNKQIEKIQKQLKELEQAGTSAAIKTLDQQISELQNKMLTADEKDLKFLAAKILLLQKELELRKENIKNAEMSVWRNQFDGQPVTPMQGKGISPILQKGNLSTYAQGQLIEITAVDKTGPTYKKVGLETDKLNKKQKDAVKDADKLQKELDKENKDRKEKLQQDLLSAANELTNELSKQLGLSEKQALQFKKTSEIISAVASGNWFTAGANALTMIIGSLKDESLTQAELTQQQIDKTNELISIQTQLLSISKGNDYFSASQTKLETINSELDKYNAKLKEVKVTFGGDGRRGQNEMDTTGWTYEQWVNALSQSNLNFSGGKENLNQILNEIINLKKEAEDTLNSIFSEILGFTTEDLADSILNGIQDGLELAADGSLGTFAKSFGEQVKTALVKNIRDALEMKLTEGFMTDFTTFMSATSEGGTTLTPTELAELEKQYAAAVGDSTAAMAALQPILEKYGLDITNSSSALSGISASVTEDTMSAFIGLMTAVRIDIKSILTSMAADADNMGQLVAFAKKIADNSEHLPRLKSIEEGIASTNRILTEKLG